MPIAHHVIPGNDVFVHMNSADCHCRPLVEYVDNTRIVIHEAFDCRCQVTEIIENWRYHARRNHP